MAVAGAILSALFDRPGTTRDRGSLEWMTKRYSRSTVRRARIGGGAATPLHLRNVEFVVGNRAGLSFRDGHGHEELKIAATDVVAISRFASDDKGRWSVVEGAAGAVLVEFWSPDDAGDVVADLTAAIRA